MPDEVVRAKRPYHRKLKPVTSTNGSKALAEIDNRLAQAIQERTRLHAEVSQLISAQERLSRVDLEINSLVQLQQRLTGATPGPIVRNLDASTANPPDPRMWERRATGEVQPGITSIPAPREPKPTTTNMGPELLKEGGFS